MIALDRVVLRSRASGAPVLAAASLEVAAGEVALVSGPSGSGKSALVGLLFGAVAPSGGRAAVFGRDLHRLRRSSLARLRRRVGVVLDDPLLIDEDSALANVALALELDGVPRRARTLRALRALDRLGLAALAALPAGLLTAGERRRLALARALVGEPRVLILDDSLSSVDAETEQSILAALDQVMAGRTAILISHRVAAVRRAQQIAVLEGGRLVELGSHDALIARGGVYAELYRDQLEQEILG
jgi:ABC-type multidrug transport system fused ATPase/permease subunit